MAVRTLKGRLFAFNTRCSLPGFVRYLVGVTPDTGYKGHVGVGHCPNIRVLRYPNVAGHAIADRVFLLLMIEFVGISFDPSRSGRRLCQRVAASTVCPDRLCSLKMTCKTCRVAARIILEKGSFWCESVGCGVSERLFGGRYAGHELWQSAACFVA